MVAERHEHAFSEAPVGDADEMAAHAAGIRHRSEQVEHEGNPDLPAGGTGVAECRMEARRKAEPDARLVETPRDTVGAEVDRHAQLLEHVRRAALRRHAAVAVLANRDAGPGDHDRGHRRHVHRM